MIKKQEVRYLNASKMAMLDSPLKQRRGVLAVRVSSSRQGIDGDSPEAQREQGQSFAKNRGIKIVKVIAYHESASKEIQPMQNVVDYCKLHKDDIDFVLVKSIDRFTRGGSFQYDTLKRQLDPINVSLMDIHGIISDQRINTLEHVGFKYRWSEFSPSRKSELLEAERASDELRDILTRMVGSEIRYTQLGYWCREARYGYRVEKAMTEHGKRSILVPHDQEAVIIKRMFELRAEGMLTDIQIADEVNRLGYRTAVKITRDKSDPTKIKGKRGGKLMTAKLLRIYIRSTIYAGVNTEKWTGDKPVKCRFNGIVSFDLFNKANRGKIILQENPNEPLYPILTKAPKNMKMVKKNKYNPDFPYKRAVTCPTCNSALLGSASKGKLGKYYPAYHCTNHGHYFRVPKPEFDAVINNFIENVTFDPERIEELLNAVMQVWEKRKEQAEKEEVYTTNKREELEAQIRVIVDKMQLVSSETAIKYMEEDISKIEDQINNLGDDKPEENSKKEINMEVILTYIKYFMEHLQELLVDHCNPLAKAEYFGVMFDSAPNYQEIKDGTQNPGMIPGLNELFRLGSTKKVDLVRGAGLEPARSHDPQILSLVRLPITSPAHRSLSCIISRLVLIANFFIFASMS